MATNKSSNKNKTATKPPAKKTDSSKLSDKKNTNQKTKGKKVFKGIILSILFLFLSIFVIGVGYIFAIIKSIPPLDVQAVINLSQPTSLYDDNEVFMDNLHSEVDRSVIPFDQMPDNLKNAYISIEDQRFYSHSGIDLRRIAGSMVTDVVKILKGKSGFHGGSTLTQQLLKNTILSNEDFIVERKIKEIWLALKLEKQLSKDQILCQYLNTIPLGGTAYGVEAASNLYFGKSASELNLIESAYIAGITQAPTTYSAYNEKNKKDPSSYINRTKTVLSKMKELGYITEEEFSQAIADIDNSKLVFTPRKIKYTLDYEWYINPTVSQVKNDLKEKYKYSDEEVSKLLANGGLKIYTNMDRELQDYTQEVLNNYRPTKNDEFAEGSKTPAFQASATITDYRTGKVLAMVGGRGEQGANALNRAYGNLKSIGSTTKPLTAYGPAINEKIMTAGSTIDDSPSTVSNVMNDDKQFSGNISLREAIRKSKNVATTAVVNTIGLNTAKSYGEKFGIKYAPNSVGTSALALGQFENDPSNPDGANTYLIASAFGVFGNNGTYIEPKLYSKVTDTTGKVLLDFNPKQKEIFSPQTAYILYDLMKGSVGYTGPNAKFGNIPVSGKTGTTSHSHDLWFSGLTPYLSASVWIGYDMPRDLSKYGINSNTAASLWGKIMKKAHEGKEFIDIEIPEGLVRSEVCIDSGKAPTDLCRRDPRHRVYSELFIEGTEPQSLCDNHIIAQVNLLNNKLATKNTPKNLIVNKIFVKKSNPNTRTSDYRFIVPTEYDDYTSTEEENDMESESNDDNSENEETDTDIDNDDKPDKPNKPNKPNKKD